GNFRAYADLKGALIAPGALVQLKAQTPLVHLVKMNQFQNDVVRVVVDLKQAHPYRPTFIDNPPRFVFHVAKEASQLPPLGAEAQPTPPEVKISPPPAANPPSQARSSGPSDSMARQLGLKVRRIIIDPGHGGKDLGASAFGLKEKDIALTLSRKLKNRLDKRLTDVEVVLTRTDDRFITLDRRTKIARDQKGDLFISLHVNANSENKVEGFETYILNFATDRSAMAVAARENATAGKTMAELDDLLRIIAKNTKISESRAMAQTLHKSALNSVRKKYKVRDLGLKEAPFYVLVGTNVPSILIEIGFVTNEKEAKLLGQDEYLNLIADGLADGLVAYTGGL
ncbi:MAG: N-acetylmuramoyl-L-alanine amidase, partial [Candidatus Adiutrix sp.]